MPPAAQPPQQEQHHPAHQQRPQHPLVHRQGQVGVVDGVVYVAVGGQPAQQADHRGHVPVVPGRCAILRRVGVGESPVDMVPDLEPAGQQRVEPGQQRGAAGVGGVEQIAGQQAAGGQQRVERQGQPLPGAAQEDRGQKPLGGKKQKQQDHGHAGAAAAGAQQGIGRQRREPGPVEPAQPVPPQPAPGEKDPQQPGPVAVVVAVAEIPVAGIKAEGHQRGGVVQKLNDHQPGGRGSQVDPQRPAQVHPLGGDARQHRQQEPDIVAVPGRKPAVADGRGGQRHLGPAVIPGPQHTFCQQQHQGAAGQPQPGQVAQAGQGGLDVGTEYFGKDQQQHQCGAEQRFAHIGALAQRAGRGCCHGTPPLQGPVHRMQAHTGSIIPCRPPKGKPVRPARSCLSSRQNAAKSCISPKSLLQ